MKYLILGLLFIIVGALNAILFKNTNFNFVGGIMLGIGAALLYKYFKTKRLQK
jgi:uncharacterized membrane protein YuzA (DUF378 family)